MVSNRPLDRGIQLYEMLFYRSGSTILQLIPRYLFITIILLSIISLFILMIWSLEGVTISLWLVLLTHLVLIFL